MFKCGGSILFTPLALMLGLAVSAVVWLSYALATHDLLLFHAITRENLHTKAQNHLQSLASELRLALPDHANLQDETLAFVQAHDKINVRGALLSLTTLQSKQSKGHLSITEHQRFLTSPLITHLPPTPLVQQVSITEGTVLNLTGTEDDAAQIWTNSPSDFTSDFRPLSSPRVADAMKFLTGMPATQVKAISAVYTNCNALPTQPSAIIWVSGPCEPPASSVLGSVEKPVFIIIENGDVLLRGNSKWFGIVVSLQRDSALHYRIQMSTDSVLTGALISNHGMTSSSLLNVRWDIDVLYALQNSPFLQRITPVKGSWRDF